MFAPFLSLSLATSFFALSGAALDFDAKSQDSIKTTAKTLAGGIVAKYKSDLKADLIPGLFSDDYYWWEAGAVFGSLIDYSYLVGDSQNDDLIAEGVAHQIGQYDAFMPTNQSRSLGNDDQSYWGLTAMSAAEDGFTTSKLGNLSWVDLAANVFNTQVERWEDKTCNGGFRWQIYQFNAGYTYKNSITAGNFFLLAARLAKFTGNTTYSDWAEKTFQWTQDIGLVSKDYAVYDGTDVTENCTKISKMQWSSDHAIFTEAAAHMYNVTKGSDKWRAAVTGFANATTVFQTDNGILYEASCEKKPNCNVDQRAFKGVAARSFARAAVSAPFVSESLTSIIQASAKAAAENCSGADAKLECKFQWTGKGDAVSVDKGLGEAFSALAVVQALLVPDAKAPATASSSNGTSSSGSSNGTSGGSSNGTAPADGSGKTADNKGAADALVVSRNLVVAVAVLAAVLL